MPGQNNFPGLLRDYIDATNESSARARWAVLIMVTGSVIILAAVLSSMQNSWVRQRIANLSSSDSTYIVKLFDIPKDSPAIPQLREELEKAFVRGLVDNAYTVKVPFFGVTFDVNDLGLVGGTALAIMLGFLWYCIVREEENLKLTFNEIAKRGLSAERALTVYELLAMRQVLTLPPLGNRTSSALKIFPLLLVFTPAATQTIVFAHDLSTAGFGEIISQLHTGLLFSGEAALLAIILGYTWACFVRLSHVENLWANEHARLKGAAR